MIRPRDLVAEWRRRAVDEPDAGYAAAMEVCADELETAVLSDVEIVGEGNYRHVCVPDGREGTHGESRRDRGQCRRCGR